jgi:hypothetical protein
MYLSLHRSALIIVTVYLMQQRQEENGKNKEDSQFVWLPDGHRYPARKASLVCLTARLFV